VGLLRKTYTCTANSSVKTVIGKDIEIEMVKYTLDSKLFNKILTGKIKPPLWSSG
jgi:hypothetical protein